MTPNRPLLEVRSVSKQYSRAHSPQQILFQHAALTMRKLLGLRIERSSDENFAVNKVSFDAFAGEMIGIVGENGAGKSTLLQIIAGTIEPTEGYVKQHGKIAALLELGAGFNLEYTGAENIKINASILGLTRRQIEDRFAKIVRFSELGDHIDQPIKTYSSGMIMRLAFSIVAHVDADILIIDETLAVGDAYFSQKCIRYFKTFTRNGGSILFVSHDSNAVLALCSRAVLLERGKIISSGTSREIIAKYLDLIGSKINRSLEDGTANGDTVLKSHQDAPREIAETDTQQDFGRFSARIISVKILSENGRKQEVISGGDMITLQIDGEALEKIKSPIFGFQVKNKYGQSMFGENSYDANSRKIRAAKPGTKFSAQFSFRLPVLADGEYTVMAQISDGTPERHKICCWIHEAIKFESISPIFVQGVFHQQMERVEIKCF